jgi:Zn-dependent peptidase ImmA (M78 family)
MSEISFEPRVLKWARVVSFGSNIEVLESKLTKSLGISSEEILSWESGLTQPTFNEIKALSGLYKRPLAVFFLSEPPDENTTLPDFRTHGSKTTSEIAPETRMAIRRAKKIQEYASTLYAETGRENKFKFKKYSVRDNPDRLARFIREEIGVTFEMQFSNIKYDTFFEYLREKLELTGVITLKSGTHDSFPTTDCRAFSLTDKQPFVILINNKDTEGGKNFSLMHEFAHVLLRKSGICNDFGDSHVHQINPIEVFCNQFAGSFLVPDLELKSHPLLVKKQKIDSGEFDELVSDIAKSFKVGRLVILRRLKDIGFVSVKTYKEKSEKWLSEPPITKKGGGHFSLTTVMKKNGLEYSKLVIDAYNSKKISRSEISGYLGVKTKHLSKLEKMINKHAR